MQVINRIVYAISRFIFKVALISFFGFEVTGKENLPKKGPFIMVSNHVSYADPPVVGVTCNTVPLIFMAKRELFHIPFFGLWFKHIGCIPVERKSRSFAPLKIAVEKLKHGESLAVFPEGTRSEDGNLKEAEPGIGLLALKTGVPIVPVYISGTDKVLPKGKKCPKLYKIKSSVGRIVDISEKSNFPDKRTAYKYIGEKVMSSIAKLKSE